jgi:hypothetical protein
VHIVSNLQKSIPYSKKVDNCPSCPTPNTKPELTFENVNARASSHQHYAKRHFFESEHKWKVKPMNVLNLNRHHQEIKAQVRPAAALSFIKNQDADAERLALQRPVHRERIREKHFLSWSCRPPSPPPHESHSQCQGRTARQKKNKALEKEIALALWTKKNVITQRDARERRRNLVCARSNVDMPVRVRSLSRPIVLECQF